MVAKRTMSDENFKGIVEGMNEALAHVRGEAVGVRVFIPAEIDVRAIRERLGMSQAMFASRHGFSVARVRDWEQGRRVPDPGVRAFLKVIAESGIDRKCNDEGGHTGRNSNDGNDGDQGNDSLLALRFQVADRD